MNLNKHASLGTDDELENFLKERRAKVAEDKARLERGPPYMEMKANRHRAYGATLKENIPPKSTALEKEDVSSMGLPLGLEYERTKQRLQQERRVDYRSYLAQKKLSAESGPSFPLNKGKPVKCEVQTGVLPKQRPASRRDASTLTEDGNEEPSSAAPRPGRPVEEGECSEEPELMGGGRHRRTEVELEAEKRRSRKTEGRETKENPGGVRDEEFATGLIIGASDTEDSRQRRKERYRRELQEQIAERHRSKKREEDLELKVAATGVIDPEKQRDRIRQFGLSRRRPLTTAEDGPTSRGDGDRGLPPLELPHMAFHSPLLQYSSILDGGALSPTSQPAAPPLPRSMDIPRVPWFPPPPTFSEAYRSPYGEPHPSHGRNLLNPSPAYYGHLSGPGAVPLMPYWNAPPVGAMPNQFGNQSPHSQRSGSSFPEPPAKASSVAAVDSQVKLFPSERSRSARERIVSYREELKQQIQERQERKLLEREELRRYEARLEADRKNHQPWGRGGGGAPLRDSTGNLIADLNQMHKLNEEAYSNPEQQQRRAEAAMTARRAEFTEPNERVSGTVAQSRIHGFTHVQTPQFARGNVFPSQPSQQQLLEQDKYKAYLKQQIDEKVSKKAEERERLRLEDEKEEKRLAEQRAQMQREYEEEQERTKRREVEQKAKNEELIQLSEQRRKEAVREKEEAEQKENAALRRRYERERQARVEELHRGPSPPIPTLQGRRGPSQNTPRPPTVDSQRSSAQLSERSMSGLQSPPVPARRNQLRAAGVQRDVISALSALHRRFRSEQKRLEGRLQQHDREEVESSLSDRQRERPQVDVFDMARLRRQVHVRRPNSTKMKPRNLQQIHDSLQLNHADGETRLDLSEFYKMEDVGETSRRRDDKEPCHLFGDQRSTARDEYFDLFPPQQNDSLRSETRRSSRGPLLDSESAFIDPLGNAFLVSRNPDLENPPLLSARERRRLASHAPLPQDQAGSSRPSFQHDQQEAEPSGDERSQDRAGCLTALSRRGNTAGTLDLSDDDSTATDPWMRPGTSDTLKCLDQPSRRKRFAT
ncbi:centrosome and spindle pole-associated protein 1-like [Brachionichthys hirsutus]|uniref:centrosome and spindle pole-associated protein 1-like n=1 Tax=Brachionichthys hirsutus TaxID=412623 RepID=UPI003604479E